MSLRLVIYINSVTLNKTYLNIVEIFYKLFRKINNIKIKNLIVTLTQKRGYFKLMVKNKCRSHFDKAAAVAAVAAVA